MFLNYYIFFLLSKTPTLLIIAFFVLSYSVLLFLSFLRESRELSLFKLALIYPTAIIHYIAHRFAPQEAITHGVETVNLCEISVDVADVGSDSWSLKIQKDAQEMISGNVFSKYTPCLYS